MNIGELQDLIPILIASVLAVFLVLWFTFRCLRCHVHDEPKEDK